MSFKSAEGLSLITEGYWQSVPASTPSGVASVVWLPTVNISGVYALTASIQLLSVGVQVIEACQLVVTINNLNPQTCFLTNGGVNSVIAQVVTCSIILDINAGDVIRLSVLATTDDVQPYTVSASSNLGGIGFGRLYKMGDL